MALAALLLLAGAAVMLLPWIASTQIVRDRIAWELSLWSGYRVSLGEAPEIDVWPTFKAALRDVSFHPWSGEEPAVLEADLLDLSLSPVAALRGRVEFTGVAMHRPSLRLTRHGDVLDLPASPGGGRMVRAIETARAVVGVNPASPDQSALPTHPFGTVEFLDGKIAIVSDEETENVTALNGKITWPALNRGGRINATAIWRGETVSVEASSGAPLILIAGGTGQLDISLKSALAEASFEGQANFSGETQLAGSARIASPSLRRMLEWTRVPIAPSASIGAASLAGDIEGSIKRIRLNSAVLTFGSNRGNGVVDITLTDEVPAISGTLAFDKLDLRTYLAAFTSLAAGTGNVYAPIDTGIASQLSLDLRLSAPTATLGDLTLADVAASTQTKGTLTALDLSHANAFGGELQAGIRIDTIEGKKTVELRVLGNDFEALALAKAAGGERLLPQGKANLSIILKGVGDDWNAVLGTADGSVTATSGPGMLGGVDLQKFRERWTTGGFFPLSEIAGGPLPLAGIDFKAKVTGGVARIEKADVMLEGGRVLSFSGIIPYFGRALALSGHLASVGPDGTRGIGELPFFIGGAWDSPYIAPVVPALEQRE